MNTGVEMSAEEFEMHVADALDGIPEELAALVDNCVILVQDDPPPDLPDTLGSTQVFHLPNVASPIPACLITF